MSRVPRQLLAGWTRVTLRSKGTFKKFYGWIAFAKDKATPKWRQQAHSIPRPPAPDA